MVNEPTPPNGQDPSRVHREPDDLPSHGEEDAGALEPAEGAEPLVSEPGVQAPVDVEVLQAQARRAEELADRLKRVEAEFLNETRRIRRNAEEQRKYAIEQVVVDLLPVVDALASARATVGDDEAAAPMRSGLDLVEKQLGSILSRHGVAPIDALGLAFDPSRHQAMMVVERGDCAPQTVCEVVRRGYELNGRVVRPAEVIVSRAPAAPAATEQARAQVADEDAPEATAKE